VAAYNWGLRQISVSERLGLWGCEHPAVFEEVGDSDQEIKGVIEVATRGRDLEVGWGHNLKWMEKGIG